MQVLSFPPNSGLPLEQLESSSRSESRYRNLVENARDIIYTIDLTGRFTWINQTGERMTGYSFEETCQMNIADIIAPEYLEQARSMIRQKVNHQTMPIYALEIIVKDGCRMAVEINSWPLLENGEVVGIQGIARDVTERQRTEAALQRSEERYRVFIENSSEGIWLFEVEVPCSTLLPTSDQVEHFYRYGYLVECNNTYAQMYGFKDAGEIVGVRLSNLLPQSVPENVAYISAFIESGYRMLDAETQEFDKNGDPKYFLNNLVGVVENNFITSAWGTQRDITKLKLAEEALRLATEQLRQSQKFDAIGQLAGGIAHDFNNLLTAINGYSDIILKRLDGSNPLRPKVEQIKKAGERAASLTHQLLAFSRKQMLQPEVLDLNFVISDMGQMLRRLIGEDIELNTLLKPDIAQVKADPGQISQVIMNLVVNARDAMPLGGKLTVETANVSVDEKYAAWHAAIQPGHYVMLAVSDTGVGMDAETQKRIFEPFFTTKEMGKGTGLGLATVYGIVKQSGGYIWVYSELNKGTTFKVYLPVAEEVLSNSDTTDADTAALPQGQGTIFLVEDEEQVRLMTREILEMCGYEVLEASNGVEALALYEQQARAVDLLVTDVVMPQMSGRELAERLTKQHPQLRVLYTSGYTDDAIVHHGVIEEGTNFIQKPFTPNALAQKVRAVLEQAV